MDKRPLGRTGMEVPPLCFGGNVFGWTVDEAGSRALLDALVAADCAFIDTADVYSTWVPGNRGGESEAFIGRWLQGRGGRERVIIATKCGMEMAPDKKGLSRRYIQDAVDASLHRLQTDYIDLYQAHRDDPDTPLEETLDAFAGLIKAGKVRAIGASNYTAARLKEALAVSAREGLPRYETLQPHYNLVERADYEAELEPLVRAEGLGVIPYWSLASGFLTGKYRSVADLGDAKRKDSVQKYLNERGLGVLRALDEVAQGLGANPAQAALAWLMAQPSITAPIASATSERQLADLVAAARLDLDQAALDRLDAASR